jgi:hypothetical protein
VTLRNTSGGRELAARDGTFEATQRLQQGARHTRNHVEQRSAQVDVDTISRRDL